MAAAFTRGRLHINVNVVSCLSCLVLSFASKKQRRKKGIWIKSCLRRGYKHRVHSLQAQGTVFIGYKHGCLRHHVCNSNSTQYSVADSSPSFLSHWLLQDFCWRQPNMGSQTPNRSDIYHSRLWRLWLDWEQQNYGIDITPLRRSNFLQQNQGRGPQVPCLRGAKSPEWGPNFKTCTSEYISDFQNYQGAIFLILFISLTKWHEKKIIAWDIFFFPGFRFSHSVFPLLFSM